MNKQRETLEKNKYFYVKDMISADQCRFLRENIEREIAQGRWFSDDDCPRSMCISHSAIIESIFPFLVDKLNTMLQMELVPAYAYCRHYPIKETMFRHKDRPSCEYSITLTVDYPRTKQPWEICFGNEDHPTHILIERGDAVIYKGCEISHWREPNPNRWQIQIFYHFVNVDGPYKHYAYDKRNYYEFDQQMYDEFTRRGN